MFQIIFLRSASHYKSAKYTRAGHVIEAETHAFVLALSLSLRNMTPP